jgi:ribosomal protein S18 acetylase RimI-like enzyme
MSAKDAALLEGGNVHVIPNGVDLDRFRPQPESQGAHILFVGSFAHFPNVVAYQWFLDEVWPIVADRVADARFTVIAGRNPHLYWPGPRPADARIDFHEFISDVRPFYEAANIVVVPTRVSAGTNLKVLEAMACERAVVSTESGCAGLGLHHGQSVWIADEPEEFAHAIETLVGDFGLRSQIGRAGRRHAEAQYGWDRIGASQRKLWTSLLNAPGVRVRRGTQMDLQAIARIQQDAHGASTWEPSTYFTFDVHVAERNGVVAGFMVSRTTAPGEAEILNLAVAIQERRCGVGTALIEALDEPDLFLEVRPSNLSAQSLYRKLGFRVVGERKDYYDDPVETALVMRRSRGSG